MASEPAKTDVPMEGSAKRRSARRQVLLIGALAFCGPGLFNALNGLGSAGSDDPTMAAVANTCLYLTFAVSGYFGGVAMNLLGPKPLFVLGGLAFAAYPACIYFSSYYGFLPVVGGVILGMGAGVFWTAQSSLMMIYGTEHSRGSLIALFWIIFNFGGVAGGLLQFGINYHNEESGANAASYFAFIVIMVLGAVSAPCILASPSNVVREDGTKVEFECSDSPLEELRAALGVIGDPFVWASALFWLASNWFYTYDFSGFNGHQFNVRTRGLNSASFWGAQMLAAWLFGKLLDSNKSALSRARQGLFWVALSLLVSLLSALWGNFGLWGSCQPGVGWDKGRPCSLDFAEDFVAAIHPMITYFLLGAADAIYQTYALWLMSMIARGDARKTIAYAGAYKGIQSLGAGFAWLIDASGNVSYRSQGIITLVIAGVACLPILQTFKGLKTDEAEAAP